MTIANSGTDLPPEQGSNELAAVTQYVLEQQALRHTHSGEDGPPARSIHTTEKYPGDTRASRPRSGNSR